MKIASTEAIGRPHIAQAMLEKGYVLSLREAFDRFIAFGKPAYVERTKVAPTLAAEIISRANGLPVLAHPFTLAEPEKMIASLKEHGLAGIEVYYGGYFAGRGRPTPEPCAEIFAACYRRQRFPRFG